MRHTILGFAGTIIISSMVPAIATAQETGINYFTDHVSAPSNALELRVGTAYTQGFGRIAPGRTLSDVSGAGIGLSFDVDYRIDTIWSLGFEGQYQSFTSAQNAWARGLAANFGATYHLAPFSRVDPWARLGTGYRLLWEQNPTGANMTQLRHGFELATLKVGYDIRVSPDVAIAPVIGADLTMFVWENPSTAPLGTMSSSQFGTFLYAGLQGRFDFGGTRDKWMDESYRVAAKPPALPAAPPEPLPPPAEMQPVTPSLAVGEDILKQCELDLDSIEKAPKFDFDQTDLLPSDIAVLKQIAECFSTGPLKGQPLALVGRADPRGTIAYNKTLGWKRATNVAEFLINAGVPAEKIQRSSRGKLDAKGTDEASWSVDRRVDVFIPHE